MTEPGMERIFPNLYRFSTGPHTFRKVRSMNYAYLLVRQQGNLLMAYGQRGSTIVDYFDEVEALGGIDRQFISHYHDANRGDFNQLLFDRFGCKLNYHHAERKTVRAKTKCPEEEFGDEGLQLGSDFEAYYFPGHTIGHSIHRWRYRGKRFLFTGHVINLGEKGWSIGLDPNDAPQLKSQFTKLPKVEVDYALPSRSPEGQEEFHRFSDSTRKSFRNSLRSKLKPKSAKDSMKLDCRMDRLFPDLYRFSYGPWLKARFWSHVYLLVRKQGNLLLSYSQNGSSVAAYFDEIEKLGGITKQFAAHHHDARGEVNEAVYERFGCELVHHASARKQIRQRAKCPTEEFGDEGLQIGKDFEAIYFPGEGVGHSLFRWRSRGKSLLFTSHVVSFVNEDWDVDFNPDPDPSQRPEHFAKLPGLEADYALSGLTPEADPDYHEFTDKTRKSLSKAIQAKLKTR